MWVSFPRLTVFSRLVLRLMLGKGGHDHTGLLVAGCWLLKVNCLAVFGCWFACPLFAGQGLSVGGCVPGRVLLCFYFWKVLG